MIYSQIDNASGITWNSVTGTSQSASVNNGYICDNASLVTVTLPSTASVGDIVEVCGKGVGGWKVAQNASQTISLLDSTTTSGIGGYIASTQQYQSVRILCITANTGWEILSTSGSLTIV